MCALFIFSRPGIKRPCGRVIDGHEAAASEEGRKGLFDLKVIKVPCKITVKDTTLEKILYVRHNSTSELTLSKQLVPIDGGGRGLSRDVRR